MNPDSTNPTEGMQKKGYLVFDIGCIECGESSEIVGVFTTLKEAQKSRKAAAIKQNADWQGQHYFSIYDLKTLKEVEND